MTKFDVSRAVRSSDLPKLARLLMFVLLDHADTDSAVIPEQFTPSLSELAAQSGMGRNTVQEKLRDLESAGWVIRQRPPVEQSREGARTQYRLAVPVGAGTQPRSHTDLPLGRTPTQARSHTDLGVGRTASKPRSHNDPISNLLISANQSNQRAGAQSDGSRNGKPGTDWLDDAVDLVTERLTATTGRTYDRRDITDSITSILRGRKSGTPAAFIRGCVEKNVLQFEPTPMPPRYERDPPDEVAR